MMKSDKREKLTPRFLLQSCLQTLFKCEYKTRSVFPASPLYLFISKNEKKSVSIGSFSTERLANDTKSSQLDLYASNDFFAMSLLTLPSSLGSIFKSTKSAIFKRGLSSPASGMQLRRMSRGRLLLRNVTDRKIGRTQFLTWFTFLVSFADHSFQFFM